MNITQSLCFDDVLLRPRYSDIKSRSEVSLAIDLSSHPDRSLVLKTPLIASPMDTVCESKMAIHMALNGGLGIIHRFMPEDDQVQQVAAVKRYVKYIITDPYVIRSNQTTAEIEQLVADVNVHTLCVIDPADNDKFVGLITRRDMLKLENIEGIPYLLETAADVMKPACSLCTIRMDGAEFGQIISASTNSAEFTKIMTTARDHIIRRGIEKIPVVDSVNGRLLGIITSRSVTYYFDNQESATLDTYGRLRVGAAVGIRDGFLEHTARLIAAGADLICVDVANGHNEHTIQAVAAIRSEFPNIIIMSGNVCTGEGYRMLSEAGSDCVRIGIGNGSICSTRLETGIGFGQFSAVNECMDTMITIPAHEYPAKLVCDGGSLGKTGNKLKALASGACAIMLGRTLAGCEESPGLIIERNNKRVKYFRGMASRMATLSKQEKTSCKKRKLDTESATEGVDGVTELKGPVAGQLKGITNGIRSGMSYQGVYNIDELHQLRKTGQLQWALCTSIGLSETGIRVATL